MLSPLSYEGRTAVSPAPDAGFAGAGPDRVSSVAAAGYRQGRSAGEGRCGHESAVRTLTVMDRGLGMVLVVVGVVLVGVGLLVASGGLSWFGRLPGDLRFGSDTTRVVVPITSMVLVSVVLTVVVNLVVRLLR